MDASDARDRLHDILLAKCEVDQRTGCWVWTGAWDANGYGVIRIQKKIYSVHRVAAYVYRGIPLNADVTMRRRRTCYEACFNPQHLTESSNPDFMRLITTWRLSQQVRSKPRCSAV